MDIETKNLLWVLIPAVLITIVDGISAYKEKKAKEITPPPAITKPAPVQKKPSENQTTLKAQQPKPEAKKTSTPQKVNTAKKTTATPVKKNVTTKKVTPAPTPVKKDPPKPSAYDIFFNNHTASSFVSDSELLNYAKMINQNCFGNLINLKSISYIDFSTVPGIKKEDALRYRGQTYQDEKKGVFIIVNENFKHDPSRYKSTVAHEMIHAYIFQKYIMGTTSEIEKTFYYDQSTNHKGIFKEIEKTLESKGYPVSKDYIHMYDEKYLEKRLIKK